MTEIKLDVGCGSEGPREGYIGCDIRALPGVTTVCPAWEVSKYHSSVWAIRSRHMLEHLTWVEVDMTLTDWRKCLIPGGRIEIIVPNMDYHIQQWLDTDWRSYDDGDHDNSVLRHALAGFWGWQDQGLGEYHDVHKSGYNASLLRAKLEEHGFWIVDVRANEMHLTATAMSLW